MTRTEPRPLNPAAGGEPRPTPPPLDPETAVLGALLHDPGAITELDQLNPEHFYRPEHARIYEAISRAVGEHGTTTDPRHVSAELLRTPTGRSLATAPAFLNLVGMAPVGGDPGWYARQIIEAWQQRQARAALQRGLQQLDNPDPDVEAMRDRLAADLEQLGPGQRHTGPAAVDWTDLWATATTPPDYLAGHILARRKVITIYSPGKAGKSLLAIDIGAALATGTPVIDDHQHEPMHVLYVDQEMTPEDWRDRLTDMGYGPDDDLTHLHLYQLQDWPPLDSPEGGRALVQAAIRDHAEIVIIDTLSKVINGVENENDTQQAFYRNTLVPLKRAGCTVLVLDHSGKDITRGARGGSAKTDNVDLAWELLARGRDTLSLRRTHTRFRHDMETIWLDRKAGPLRHIAQDIDQEVEKLIDKCAEYMTAFSPDESTSRTEMVAQLKSAGCKFRNETISAAWRRVRQQNGWQV